VIAKEDDRREVFASEEVREQVPYSQEEVMMAR